MNFEKSKKGKKEKEITPDILRNAHDVVKI